MPPISSTSHACRSAVVRLAAPALALVLAAGLFGAAGLATAMPVTGTIPIHQRSGALPSSAAMRLMREAIARGEHVPPAFIERFGLDERDDDEATAEDPGAPGGPQTPLNAPTLVAGATDRQINDRTNDGTCSYCASRPMGQAETTIAAWNGMLLAGWNDTKGFCDGTAVQGYGYSLDNGNTWVDAGPVPALPTGRYRGDPVHIVNRKTGQFYILGLYEVPGNSAAGGLALARGHFAGGTFVFDLNTQIAIAGSDFLDKPWAAVDSVSGNVYVTYTRFLANGGDQIEFIRSTTNGLSWDAPIIANLPAAFGNVQGSRPVVGPNGEVYVVWYEYGVPLSANKIRRSNNFGVSFMAESTVSTFYENSFSGAPGYRRGFAPTDPSIAVDRSNGPHRGRIYVAWDEALDFYDAPAATGPVRPEVENNNYFATAQAFTVGDRLSGSLSTVNDIDLYRFSGNRGQTIVFSGSAAADNTVLAMRVMAAGDTSNVNNYRYLAFNQEKLPAIVFTLPATGTYYLRITNASSGIVGTYTIDTVFDTPTPGERARDHRDRFAAWSDNGLTWSTPARLNDDNPWFDGIFPELTVDGSGGVHAFWHDFRDDPNGALSYEYMTTSTDGGVTWSPNQRISDVQSFWSFNACGSANQGDYQGIDSDGSQVYPCWSDSRFGDPDVFTETENFAQTGVPEGGVGRGGRPATIAFAPPNPNPAVGAVALSFEMEHAGSVSLDVFDVTGALVRNVLKGDLEPGEHQSIWDGRDAGGRPVAGGLYFIKLSAAGEMVTRRVTVLR